MKRKFTDEAEAIEELGGYVTVTRAAELIGVQTRAAVMRYVARGKIRFHKWEDRLMLFREDVEAVAAIPKEDRHGGRPPREK